MQATAELSNLASSLAVRVKVDGRREVGPLPDAPTSAAESAEHPLLPLSERKILPWCRDCRPGPIAPPLVNASVGPEYVRLVGYRVTAGAGSPTAL